jgi:hypothetical protein
MAESREIEVKDISSMENQANQEGLDKDLEEDEVDNWLKEQLGDWVKYLVKVEENDRVRGWQEGWKEGWGKGWIKGWKEGLDKVAIAMLIAGKPISEIVKVVNFAVPPENEILPPF